MTGPWATCHRCGRDLYPRLARRSDEGWECGGGKNERSECGRKAHVWHRDRTRAEDIIWMAETGESAEGAAQRLGMTWKALEKWCRFHRDLVGDAWAQLRTRDPWSLDPREQVRRAGWERVA